MLQKSSISNITIYSPDWFTHRIGKFTSSKIHTLMTKEGFGKGGLTYLYHKLGEELTGKSNEKEFEFDEDLEWGNLYETEGIKAFGKCKGIDYLVVQKMIHVPGTRFSSTPDAIWVHNECVMKEDEYNVSTLEIKCPRTYHYFIKYSLCKTPADLKKAKPEYYWQVIDQMSNCGSAKGYFAAYHPYFPAHCNLSIIEFRKMELWNDFMFLDQRKKLALNQFQEIKSQLLGVYSN